MTRLLMVFICHSRDTRFQKPWPLCLGLVKGFRDWLARRHRSIKQPVMIKVVEPVGVTGGRQVAASAFVNDPNPKNLVDLGIGKFNFAEAADGVTGLGKRRAVLP